MGWMIGPAQVIEFAGFWPLECDFLANYFLGFPRIASRDSSRSSGWSRAISMRPRERRETSEQDLFRSRLDQIIDMKHALVKLARTIDWGFLEQTFGAVYTDKPGQPPGASDPQAQLRPFRRGFVRSLGGESVLPVLLRRGIFPTRVGVRPFVADALAPADGGRQAQGAVAGEPGGGDPDGGDEALRPRLCCDRHHGAAEGGDVSDRRQTAQPGARAAGATDEEARREPAPILCAGRQAGSDQAPALRPCSSIQARQPELTQAQDLSRPCHPRHRAAHCQE